VKAAFRGGTGCQGGTWGALFVLAASVLWGTTGTAATFAPGVSPLAIGAAAWSAPAGIALGLLAGLTYSLYSWAAHRMINTGVPARAVMGTVFGFGGLLLMPVLAATGAPLLGSWQSLAVGGYMALVPMFAGYVLFGWGLARVQASTATTLSLAETVVAAVLAVVVVGERLPALGWAGAGLILGSLFVLTLPGPRARLVAGTPVR